MKHNQLTGMSLLQRDAAKTTSSSSMASLLSQYVRIDSIQPESQNIRGGVQLHFCTLMQCTFGKNLMAMYINVHKKCTKSRKSPGNGLKNVQNMFKILTMLVHYAKTKENVQILVFAQKQLKIICETFPNQWADKTFLVRHNFFCLGTLTSPGLKCSNFSFRSKYQICS